MFSKRPNPVINSPDTKREIASIFAYPLFIPFTPMIRPVTSIPQAQIVSAIPRVLASLKERISGSARIWNIPINSVITEDMIMSMMTPRFLHSTCHPVFTLSRSGSLFSITDAPMPRLTTAALMTVKKKVQISITSSNFISLTDRRSPAIIGENRYLADPARDTRPLAFEYSSAVRRSVMVALYEGSSSAEKMALTETPMHI